MLTKRNRQKIIQRLTSFESFLVDMSNKDHAAYYICNMLLELRHPFNRDEIKRVADMEPRREFIPTLRIRKKLDDNLKTPLLVLEERIAWVLVDMLYDCLPISGLTYSSDYNQGVINGQTLPAGDE